MGRLILDSALSSSPEVASGLKDQLIALLPVGAMEQHGPHLPLTTDTILAEGVARRIARLVGGLLMPAFAYGDAWSAEGYAGTISISPDTTQEALIDIGSGLRRAGFAGLVTVNGHFGNRAPIGAAAEVLIEEGLPVLALDYPGLEEAAAEFCVSEPAAPGFYHADEVETSMMLALAPDAVRMDRAVAEYPVFPADFGTRPIQLSTFNTSGVFGDPRGATAATGEKIIARIVAESVAIIGKWRQSFG
jgi:creatinine amidohydrolase